MRTIAIIPARGGSKRIPQKNIKDFLGKPIIAYTIEKALESNLFDKVMVSTDSIEIKTIAEKFGAEVPFLRSKKNSDDYATTENVIEEVIQEYKAKDENFDTVCCLYPTNPLLNIFYLSKGMEKLEKENLDSVFSITKFTFPIQRAFLFKKDKVLPREPENFYKRSQDLEETYQDAAQFYWVNTSAFNKFNTMLTKNTGGVIIENSAVQDIDTIEDWKLAEMKYKALSLK